AESWISHDAWNYRTWPLPTHFLRARDGPRSGNCVNRDSALTTNPACCGEIHLVRWLASTHRSRHQGKSANGHTHILCQRKPRTQHLRGTHRVEEYDHRQFSCRIYAV